MIVFERRAAAILYNFLRSLGDPRPFLLPANICPVVPETFVAAGQPFELIDISEPWLEIDAALCLDVLRTRPGACAGILFARPYGSERDPSSFFEAARQLQPDLVLIDDKCLCLPDCSGDSNTVLADVTLFSTGYAKHTDLSAGGFAFVSDGFDYQRASGGPQWLDLDTPDISWDEHRRNTLAATSAAGEQKRKLNAIYAAALPAAVALPRGLQQWRFNILVPEPDALVASIFEAGLFASRHYPPLGHFPAAARLHAQVVNLFNDGYFDEHRARRIAEIVLRHLDITRR